MMNNGMYSSKTDLWSTPQDFYDELNREFGFVLDACALQCNAKCKVFFSPDEDGLRQDWASVTWCNPPYGREIGKWGARPAAKLNAATRSCAFCQRELTRDGSTTMFWVVPKSGSCAGD